LAGKQKSKKTTVLAMAVAAIVGQIRTTDSIRFEAAANGVVLFFDNEQGESFAARTMKLILKLAGLESSSRLIYCDLREFSPSERLEIIKAAVAETPNVLLVVVDGVVDLMNDFMDAKEGHTTITELLRLSSMFDIHVAGVIHQNKGASKDPRAHVGSISSQKCEREIMTEVDEYDRAQSIVTCKESRAMPFDTFAIRWDKGMLPIIVQEGSFESSTSVDRPAKKAPQKDFNDFDELFIRNMISSIFSSDPKPKYTKLWRAIKVYLEEHGHKVGDNRAKEFLSWLNMKDYLVSPEQSKVTYWMIKPV
jgi:hypothetical protein